MNDLHLLSYPKIDRNKTVEVTRYDETLKTTVQNLYHIMDDMQSLCLAAPQVGLNQSIFVLSSSELIETQHCFINPKIIQQENMTPCESNCLYFGDVPVMIKRPQKIEISYFDETGTVQNMTAENSLAAILAYQVDCLNGILVIDHMSKLKRERFLKKRQKAMLNSHTCSTACDHEHHH